jgi:hypothetical protein
MGSWTARVLTRAQEKLNEAVVVMNKSLQVREPLRR